MDYQTSGVDINKGNAFIKKIAPLAQETKRPGVCSSLGGFGALFDLKACGYTDPILVSTTDGVGTKLLLAIEAGHHEDIGIDLVAMCVNDLVTQGAEPLFFMDYFACANLDLEVGQAVIKGVARACKEVGCALVGGETAEMPGVYKKGDYDLGGFAVGAVERHAILPRKKSMQAGDCLIGLASNGLHSNGFSLVRAILKEKGLNLQNPCPFDEAHTLGDVLLTPTRLYVRPILNLLTQTDSILGIAHITGGGLAENIARIIPENSQLSLNLDAWPRPPVFIWLEQAGQIDAEEMLRVFNCGIGMVLVVSRTHVELVLDLLKKNGEKGYVIGSLQGDF